MQVSHFSPLKLKVFPSVYEPHEDSFLLAEHSKNLKGNVLEIGCGSGIVSLFNAKHNPDNKVVGVDLNEDAVKNAKYNALLNKVENATFHQSNLFNEVDGKFDSILFNPPYLPTEREDRIKDDKLNLALDGGKTGRETLDKFLYSFSDYLKPKGRLLLVHSSLNGVEQTKKVLNKKYSVRNMQTSDFFFEKLYLLRINRK